jgi:hypothetical protein
VTGTLVDSARLPDTDFLHALGALLDSEAAVAALARRVHDPRLDAGQFERLLRRELLDLYRWAAQRLLQASNGESTAPTASRVISLLPRVAPAVHALRRSVPFAGLGLRTSCGFADDVRERGAVVIVELARALGLDGLLESEEAGCASAVTLAPPNALVIVTGRRRTASAVRRATPARVVGATGRCSLVLARTQAGAVGLLSALRSLDVQGSCTQPRAAFVLDARNEARGVRADSRRVYPLEQIARLLHPSVVLVPEEAAELSSAGDLAGYRVLPCGPDGSTPTSVGFAADPVYGWPGDYRV